MPIAAAWRNTMANAKPLAEDHPRRAKVIALARAWEEKARARDEVLQAKNAAANRHRAWLAQSWVAEYPTPRAIIEQVAFWHSLTVADLRTASRRQDLVDARLDAVCAIWVNCRRGGGRMTLTEIGWHMGHRHHTTILSALRRRGLIPQRGDADASSVG